jgi:hypothetical protein
MLMNKGKTYLEGFRGEEQGFFCQFCGVATLVVSSTREICQILATGSEKKEEIFKNPAIFWQPDVAYCPNMVISEFFPSKPGNFGKLFSQKSLV